MFEGAFPSCSVIPKGIIILNFDRVKLSTKNNLFCMLFTTLQGLVRREIMPGPLLKTSSSLLLCDLFVLPD